MTTSLLWKFYLMQFLSQQMHQMVFTQNGEMTVHRPASSNSTGTRQCEYTFSLQSTSLSAPFCTKSFSYFSHLYSLYLRYCFEGKSFPKGVAIMPEERVQTLRQEI